MLITPANEQDRDQLYDLCREVQSQTGDQVDVMLVDQGYSGEQASIDAVLNDVELQRGRDWEQVSAADLRGFLAAIKPKPHRVHRLIAS